MSTIVKLYTLPLPKDGEVNETALKSIIETITKKSSLLSIIDNKLTNLIINNRNLHLLIGKKEQMEALPINIKPWVFHFVLLNDDVGLLDYVTKITKNLPWFSELQTEFYDKFKYPMAIQIYNAGLLKRIHNIEDTNGYKFSLVSQL
ncbi:MAG: hypothetical protein V1707_00800 [bacterium]